MTKEKLSPHMQAALTKARAAGGLWRWNGGFWMTKPMPETGRDAVIDSEGWTRPQTVYALLDRGLIEAVDVPGKRYLSQVRPTQ